MTGATVRMLSPHVQWNLTAGGLRLEAPGCVIDLGGSGVPTVPGFLAALERGLMTQAAMSAAHARVLDVLAGEDLVAMLDVAASAPDAFLSAFHAVCDRWVEDIFRSPFWETFHRGEASREQVLSFLAQLYHRTVGADRHNLVAVECCRDADARALLERHYLEEFGHAAILLKGFARCGLAHQGSVVIEQMESTRCLIASMVDLAAEDTLSYLGCYGIFHAPSTIRDEAQLVRQFEHFARMYPFAAPAFRSVCQHARLDYTLGHAETALERLVRTRGSPDADGTRSVLRGARSAAAAFRAIFDELAAIR